MAIGKVIDKPAVDSLSASYARNFTQVLNDEGYAEFAHAILALADADLVGLGYTQAEVDTLKAFLNTMNGHIAAFDAEGATPGARFYGRQIYKLYNG